MTANPTANSLWNTLKDYHQAGHGAGFQQQLLLFPTFLYQRYSMSLNFGNLFSNTEPPILHTHTNTHTGIHTHRHTHTLLSSPLSLDVKWYFLWGGGGCRETSTFLMSTQRILMQLAYRWQFERILWKGWIKWMHNSYQHFQESCSIMWLWFSLSLKPWAVSFTIINDNKQSGMDLQKDSTHLPAPRQLTRATRTPVLFVLSNFILSAAQVPHPNS